MEGSHGMLPGGYWDRAGQLQREFELTPLTGREEEMLVQARQRETASLVTALLSRCVRRLGDIHPVSEEVARGLLVADRQYLLLKLRQVTFGDLVRANLFCPWPDCGKQVSLDFRIDDVPVTEASNPGPFYHLTLSPAAAHTEDEALREIVFRLPCGADQEEASPLLADNEARALNLLLARCLQRVGDAVPPGEDRVADLSPLARAEIEAAMEHVAPRIELDMETTCPECGRFFVTPLDLHRFFFGELRTDRDQLYREVHYLAYHYHWSEREIMDMPRDRRRTYIEVLADEIERLNHDS